MKSRRINLKLFTNLTALLKAKHQIINKNVHSLKQEDIYEPFEKDLLNLYCYSYIGFIQRD